MKRDAPNWEDTKLILLGVEIQINPIHYNDKRRVLNAPIELKIEDLLKIRKEAMYQINIDSEFGKSIIIDRIEFKAGNRIAFNDNEYLIDAVLENTIIFKLISVTI